MDHLATIIPSAIVIAGGAYIYSQCTATRKETISNNKTNNNKTTAKASTSDADDSDSEESLLSNKEKKKLKERQERAAKQQQQEAALKAKKQKDAERKAKEDAAKAAAAKAEEEEKAAATKAATSGKKSTAQVQAAAKAASNANQKQQQQQKKGGNNNNNNKKQQQTQQKKEPKIKVSEDDEYMLAFVTKDYSGLAKQLQPTASKPAAAATKKPEVKKAPVSTKKQQQQFDEDDEDDGWKGVKTKHQKEKERRQLSKAIQRAEEQGNSTTGMCLNNYSDDSDIEDLSGNKKKSKIEILDPLEILQQQQENAGLPDPVQEKIVMMVPVDWSNRNRLLLIGPEGSTVNAIREKTRCWVSVPRDENAPRKPKVAEDGTIIEEPVQPKKIDFAKEFAKNSGKHIEYVKVEGYPRDCELAKKIINEFMDKGYSPTLTGGGTIEYQYKLEPTKRAVILGEKGSNLKIIQEVLSVKIIFPDKASTSPIVRIVGSRPNVDKTKKVFKSLLENGYSHITHPTWIKQVLPLAFLYRRRIIGRAGQVIKQIQKNSRCKIVFPPASDDERVFIVGDKNDIPIAVRAINKILDDVAEEQRLRDERQQTWSDDEDEYDEELAQYYYHGDDEEY